MPSSTVLEVSHCTHCLSQALVEEERQWLVVVLGLVDDRGGVVVVRVTERVVRARWPEGPGGHK
jgi:microsomal dipeptidase-like Zn-dependent dipeptidase